MATVALLGTCDTKLEELLFLDEQIRKNDHVKTILIDAGRHETQSDVIAISRTELVLRYGKGEDTTGLPRGELVQFMSRCATEAVKELFERGSIDGIVAAGGSGGTSLAAAPMRDALPIGFPKLIVSTIASGDTSSLVGETDIMLMYSVVDIAGLNTVLRNVLRNAGAAIAAAALSYAKAKADGEAQEPRPSKKRVGLTQFGVTSPGVDAIRRHLETNYGVEAYVFHATGHGGKAMERLIRTGELDAVLDLTTTEICDLVTGGILSAGETRLDAAVEAGIPNILSLGATDMTNFGPRSTVPAQFRDRRLYEHNAVVTLMRSSEEECRQIGEFICRKLRKTKSPELIQLWIPMGGVSMLAVPSGPFFDEKADTVLFDTIVQGLDGSGIKVIQDTRHVNDKSFATDIADALAATMGLTMSSQA